MELAIAGLGVIAAVLVCALCVLVLERRARTRIEARLSALEDTVTAHLTIEVPPAPPKFRTHNEARAARAAAKNPPPPKSDVGGLSRKGA